LAGQNGLAMKSVCSHRLFRVLRVFGPALGLGPALVCLVCWCWPTASRAQDVLYVQTPDTLVLQAGAILQVQGGVVLSGDARIQLAGTLVLGGGAGGPANWTDNNGSAGGVGGNGCVVCAAGGSEIGGTVTVELPTVRLATAGASFRLAGSLRLRDSLLLGSGNALMLDGHELHLLHPDPGRLEWQQGGWIVSETNPVTDADYGSIRWDVNAGAGSTSYYLPLGVSAPDLGVAFTPMTGTNSFHISTYGTGPDNLPYPGAGRYLPNPVTDLYSEIAVGDNAAWTLDRFWIIDPGENGSEVTLRYRPAEVSSGVSGSEAALLAQPWIPGLGWQGPGVGISGEPVSATLSLTAGTSAAWALALGATPLPVTCRGLLVTSGPGSVLLAWSTESELDNLGFDVQRRQTSNEWLSLGFVPGAGTSSRPHAYTFQDHTCPAEGSLYRLIQRDRQGNSQQACDLVYGRPESELEELADAALLWPNPIASQFWVSAPGVQPPSGEWRLFDGQGRVQGGGVATCSERPCLSSMLPGPAGMDQVWICSDQLPANLPLGFYVMEWTSLPEQMFKVLHLPP